MTYREDGGEFDESIPIAIGRDDDFRHAVLFPDGRVLCHLIGAFYDNVTEYLAYRQSVDRKRSPVSHQCACGEC